MVMVKVYRKILLFVILFLSIFFINVQNAYGNACWENPQSIRTYIEPSSCKNLMKEAFSTWERASNNKLKFKYVDDPSDAQIKVTFVKNIYIVTKKNNILANTNHVSSGGKMISAEIVLSRRSPNGALFLNDVLYRNMIHEIGHAIGILEHSTNPNSIMYITKNSRYQKILDEDIENLYKIYGFE